MKEDLQNIFREVLNEPELMIHDDLSEKDVSSWNSLNNVLLINKIEEFYKVKFELSEILKIKTVLDIKNLIKNKQS